ncbi:hypothetical protein Psch_02331 [Pelotomaculum schinkii]|uniref:Uncharacterized protein n=1 Tax=Pelotomaculum schinkii TaxID=78350 RepID=A0A4Y7R9H0_9FIRM|nr:hypothetical protein [Pelotomaculum schinkii]TEB05290.1 hypothetical protein Psch_02331 [Pelotomaculum schinkii]
MYLVAAFEHSLFLEQAISDLLHNGLARENILAVPLEHQNAGSDGNSLIDGAAMAGTALMVLGVIYGFVLRWGPVIWGLIGLLAGVAAGALLALARSRIPHRSKKPNSMTAEVVLIIHCRDNNVKESEQILWNNQALGVGRLDR